MYSRVSGRLEDASWGDCRGLQQPLWVTIGGLEIPRVGGSVVGDTSGWGSMRCTNTSAYLETAPSLTVCLVRFLIYETIPVSTWVTTIWSGIG